MAFGRLERTRNPQPMSEINMTPLIDVMLVLLVIFIIAAPLMASSLKLNLPQSDAATPSEAPAFVSITLDAKGRMQWDQETVDVASFTLRAQAAAQKNRDTEVQLRADRNVPYGRVAELIGLVHKAGLSRVGFVTETSPSEATPAASGAAK
jgi:biopolymer transport protein TolR